MNAVQQEQIVNVNVNVDKSITSMYIPRISCKYGEHFVSECLKSYGIGKVKRVDFRAIENNPHMKSAFVHFSFIYPNHGTENLIHALNQENGSRRIQISETEYWVLMKNKNPVVETNMNIHQLAAYVKEIEEKVVAQEENRLAQEERIAKLEEIVSMLLSANKKEHTIVDKHYIRDHHYAKKDKYHYLDNNDSLYI